MYSGVGNPNVTLTTFKVERIRLLKKRDGLLNRELADQFGVSKSQIGRILKRQAWKRPAK